MLKVIIETAMGAMLAAGAIGGFALAALSRKV
jgi:hypothetical protein